MNAEHRRPLAAFMLVFAFACVVMANGLREQVVRVFVDSGGPRPLISAVVPDILLGHSLRNVLPGPPAVSSTAEVRPTKQTQPIESRPVTLSSSHVVRAKPTHQGPHGGQAGTAPKHHTSADKPATPATPHTPVQAAPPAPTTPVHTPTPTPPSPGVGLGSKPGTGIVRPNPSGPKGLVANGGPSAHPVGPSHHYSHHGQWSHHDPGDRGDRGDRGNPGKADVRGFQAGPGNHGGPADHGHHSDHGDYSNHGNRGRDPFRGGGEHGDHHGPSGFHGGPGGHGGPGDHGSGGRGSHRH